MVVQRCDEAVVVDVVRAQTGFAVLNAGSSLWYHYSGTAVYVYAYACELMFLCMRPCT
jgi:hypothetical protein